MSKRKWWQRAMCGGAWWEAQACTGLVFHERPFSWPIAMGILPSMNDGHDVQAVLSSFKSCSVAMVDHHTLMQQFWTWHAAELKTRGYSPGAHPDCMHLLQVSLQAWGAQWA